MPYTRGENADFGKFEGNRSQWVARVLYDIAGTGGTDQVGDVEGIGWFCFIEGRKHAWIVREDNYGFFDYEVFDIAEDAQEEWDRIVASSLAWEERVKEFA